MNLAGQKPMGSHVGAFGAPLSLVSCGDWEVHWGLTDWDFDPWPCGASLETWATCAVLGAGRPCASEGCLGEIFGCGSKFKSQGCAGFGPCFHSPGLILVPVFEPQPNGCGSKFKF